MTQALANTQHEGKTAMWKSAFEPGVYLGVSNDVYHADPAIGSTMVKRLIKSPMEFWYHSHFNNNSFERTPTPAMKFGTAYHTLMLEPERFFYNIVPGKTTTKDGCLAEGEHDTLRAMQAVIERNPYHASLLRGGYAEVAIFWTDEETGLPCKIKLDYWKPHFVTDLKTTTDVSTSALRYAIPDFGYDVSGAMYMQGIDKLRLMIAAGQCHVDPGISQTFIDQFMGSETRFVFLMQEKSPPFTSRAQAITEPVAACGRDKFRMGLQIAKENYDQYGATPWPTGYEKIEDMHIEALSPSIQYA